MSYILKWLSRAYFWIDWKRNQSMSRKTRFDEIKGTIEDFFKDNSQEINIEPFSLREASKSDPGGQETFFYQGEELDVIDMDKIAKNQYKNLRVTEKNGSTINE